MTQYLLRRLSLPLVVALWMLGASTALSIDPSPIPTPKRMSFSGERLQITSVSLQAEQELEPRERALLKQILQNAGISLEDEGIPLNLKLGDVDVPDSTSSYQHNIHGQAYSITMAEDAIVITGKSPQGIFYALQTFDQLLDEGHLPAGKIVDWPDIALRMIMVDPARQNENMDYYRRVIDFAARYKINAVLCHLTDDQTSALYHEDYPELMHEHAWRPEEIKELVAFAAERHVELIPEIETLGHSRMFERLPNFADYLHQTESDTPDESWMGTDIAGYTNVLCPASPQAAQYLQKMYERAAETFDHPWIHIGFDEVDMTNCQRCIDAFGEQSPDEWMLEAFKQVTEPIEKMGKKTALWGDMLLTHRAVAEGISPEDTIIFDWYYRPDVTDDSVHFFKEKGFKVVGSPALSASPHMVIPNRRNFDNIARFTEIARENDLLGINTTIWVPVRYMSDVLWTGIAYAAAHAWGGEAFDEEAFFVGFTQDYFQSDQGAAYHKAWSRLTDVLWHRPDFYTGCWADEKSLEAARKAAEEKGDEIRENIRILSEVRQELDRIGKTVSAHRIEWNTIGQSAAILQFSMEHLLAATEVEGNLDLLAELDRQCLELIEVIEADWDRNRFADDPGKEGRFLQNQHLLYRFREMHEFHQQLLGLGPEESSE